MSGLTEVSQPLDEHAVIASKYELGDVIDAGMYGEVRHAVDRTSGSKFAIKIVTKNGAEELKQLRAETDVIQRARHENIVRCYEVLEDNTYVYIVMEYLSGGDLQTLIDKFGPLREREACRLFRSLIDALHYCHSVLFIVHRDCKPENLLFDNIRNRSIKLVDFGLCTSIASQAEPITKRCGTPSYCAPEVFDGSAYGQEVDYWSAGVTLYVALCGRLPFPASDFRSLRTAIASGAYPVARDISEEAKDLIAHLLTVDSSKRADFRFVRNHPWFAIHDQAWDSIGDEPQRCCSADESRDGPWYGVNETSSSELGVSRIDIEPQRRVPWARFDRQVDPHRTGVSNIDWNANHIQNKAQNSAAAFTERSEAVPTSGGWYFGLDDADEDEEEY